MKTCTKCKKEKAEDQFNLRSDTKKLRSHCKVCCSKAQLEKYHASPERKELHRESAWKHQLKKLYDMTIEEYDKMVLLQDTSCAICKTHLSSMKQRRLYVDHNHETGEVRGLLCSKCNWLLQTGGESATILRSAADYLDKRGSYPEV